MSRSNISRIIAVVTSTGCALALAACANEGSEQEDAPAFDAAQSTTEHPAPLTSSAAPTTSSSDPQSTSAAHEKQQKFPHNPAPAAFAGMGTASLEDQQHIPRGGGTLVPVSYTHLTLPTTPYV